MENSTFANTTATEEESSGDRITQGTRYIFICFMVLITVIGIPGNAIIVAVLTKFRKRSSTDYFVLAMSGIDLFSATVNTSCYIIRYEQHIWKVMASDIFCRLHLFSIGLTNTCTTMLLATTAFDRLKRTNCTSTTNLQSDSIKAKRICVGIVISGFALSTVLFLTTTLDLTTLSCSRLDGYETVALFFYIILALIYIFMFVVVTVCYTKVVVILRRHHRKICDMKLSTIDREADRSKFKRTEKSKIEPVDNYENIPNTSKGILTNTRQFYSQEPLPVKDLNATHGTNMNISTLERDFKKDSTYNDTKAKDHGFAVPSENNMVNIDAQTQRETTRFKKSQPPYALISIARDRNVINRTTLMMFLITLVYISTWVINWAASIYVTVVDSRIAGTVFIFQKLYMINSITNPVFYMIMSSKFKQMARSLICKL